MSNTFLSIWFVGIVGFLGLVTYAMISHSTQRIESTNLCDQMGGISVIGDKGHYHVCLRPSAVIELPTQ